VIDDSGRMVSVNDRVCELFDYPVEDLTGRPIDMLLPAGVLEAHERRREGVVEGPGAPPMGLGGDLAGRRRSGEEFPVEVSLSFVETSEGRFAIAFVSDLTARKKSEEQLLQSQKME